MAEHGFTPGKWIETNQSDWRPTNDEVGNVTWTVIQSEETGEDIAIVLEPTPHWKEAVTLDANARLFTSAKPLLQSLEAIMAKLDTGRDAPGHCHDRPGIWDDDNGEKAGQPCEWCAQWNAARAAITLATGKDA